MEFRSQNLLLQRLEAETRAAFANRFQLVDMERGQLVQEAGLEVEWVWFPENGLISIACETVGGESVSGGLVGWTGAYGVFEACGSRMSYATATVQIPGDGWRIRAAHFRELYEASPAMRTAVHKHVEATLVEARQFVACNAIHSVENRLGRALLDMMARSRVGNVLPLTQEALAQLLGVQRTTVAVTTSALQKQGLLRTGRGVVEVLSTSRLERIACSCLGTIEFARDEIYRSEAEPCEAASG
ncbi:Crp/Fnr family transcriptional regulator [Phenylobacterium terrae]|uniref:Crp/Fnr family transcriptional regulator n=1 Tax=Phenylobacterium terrae TaxID=2665495 RepID=A0ABW4N669_9CAUL